MLDETSVIPDLQVKVHSNALFKELLIELMMNAIEQNRRSHPYSSALWKPKVIIEKSELQTVISIRNHNSGIPLSFGNNRIGQSTQYDEHRIGIGIGISRVKLIAKLLGIEVFPAVVDQNSKKETIVNIVIPNIMLTP